MLKNKFSEKVKEQKNSILEVKYDQLSKIKNIVNSRIKNSVTENTKLNNIEISLEIHKMLKEQKIRKQIYNKIFEHLKGTLLDKHSIQDMEETTNQLINEQKL